MIRLCLVCVDVLLICCWCCEQRVNRHDRHHDRCDSNLFKNPPQESGRVLPRMQPRIFKVSRLEAFLPLKESQWHILIRMYASETCFQKISKTYPMIETRFCPSSDPVPAELIIPNHGLANFVMTIYQYSLVYISSISYLIPHPASLGLVSVLDPLVLVSRPTQSSTARI
jgi:hypothetical protein